MCCELLGPAAPKSVSDLGVPSLVGKVFSIPFQRCITLSISRSKRLFPVLYSQKSQKGLSHGNPWAFTKGPLGPLLLTWQPVTLFEPATHHGLPPWLHVPLASRPEPRLVTRLSRLVAAHSAWIKRGRRMRGCWKDDSDRAGSASSTFAVGIVLGLSVTTSVAFYEVAEARPSGPLAST